ncbi:MAG: hypothetical protein ACFFAT_19680, partial [Promethearchaeota archaeon]
VYVLNDAYEVIALGYNYDGRHDFAPYSKVEITGPQTDFTNLLMTLGTETAAYRGWFSNWRYHFSSLVSNKMLFPDLDPDAEYVPKDTIFNVKKLTQRSEGYRALYHDVKIETYNKAWGLYWAQIIRDTFEQVFATVTATVISQIVKCIPYVGLVLEKPAYTLAYALISKAFMDLKAHEARTEADYQTFYPVGLDKTGPTWLNEKAFFDRILGDSIPAALIGHPGAYYTTVSGGSPGKRYSAQAVVTPPRYYRLGDRMAASGIGFLKYIFTLDPDAFIGLDFDDVNLDYFLLTSELPAYNSYDIYEDIIEGMRGCMVGGFLGGIAGAIVGGAITTLSAINNAINSVKDINYIYTDFSYDTYKFNSIGYLEKLIRLETKNDNELNLTTIKALCIDNEPEYRFVDGNSEINELTLPDSPLYKPIVLSERWYETLNLPKGTIIVKTACEYSNLQIGVDPNDFISPSVHSSIKTVFSIPEKLNIETILSEKKYHSKIPLADDAFFYPISNVYIQLIDESTGQAIGNIVEVKPELYAQPKDEDGNLYFFKTLEDIYANGQVDFNEKYTSYTPKEIFSDLLKRYKTDNVYYAVYIIFDVFIPDTTEETNKLALSQATDFLVKEYFNQYTFGKTAAEMIGEIGYTEISTLISTAISSAVIWAGGNIGKGIWNSLVKESSKKLVMTSISKLLTRVVIGSIKEMFEEIIVDGFVETIVENVVDMLGYSDDMGHWVSTIVTSMREQSSNDPDTGPKEFANQVEDMRNNNDKFKTWYDNKKQATGWSDHKLQLLARQEIQNQMKKLLDNDPKKSRRKTIINGILDGLSYLLKGVSIAMAGMVGLATLTLLEKIDANNNIPKTIYEVSSEAWKKRQTERNRRRQPGIIDSKNKDIIPENLISINPTKTPIETKPYSVKGLSDAPIIKVIPDIGVNTKNQELLDLLPSHDDLKRFKSIQYGDRNVNDILKDLYSKMEKQEFDQLVEHIQFLQGYQPWLIPVFLEGAIRMERLKAQAMVKYGLENKYDVNWDKKNKIIETANKEAIERKAITFKLDDSVNIPDWLFKDTKLMKFRLTGVPPDISVCTVYLPSDATIAQAEVILQKVYGLNPVLDIRFIYRRNVIDQGESIFGKKINNINDLYDLTRKGTDVITVMATQKGGGDKDLAYYKKQLIDDLFEANPDWNDAQKALVPEFIQDFGMFIGNNPEKAKRIFNQKQLPEFIETIEKIYLVKIEKRYQSEKDSLISFEKDLLDIWAKAAGLLNDNGLFNEKEASASEINKYYLLKKRAEEHVKLLLLHQNNPKRNEVQNLHNIRSGFFQLLLNTLMKNNKNYDLSNPKDIFDNVFQLAKDILNNRESKYYTMLNELYLDTIISQIVSLEAFTNTVFDFPVGSTSAQSGLDLHLYAFKNIYPLIITSEELKDSTYKANIIVKVNEMVEKLFGPIKIEDRIKENDLGVDYFEKTTENGENQVLEIYKLLKNTVGTRKFDSIGLGDDTKKAIGQFLRDIASWISIHDKLHMSANVNMENFIARIYPVSPIMNLRDDLKDINNFRKTVRTSQTHLTTLSNDVDGLVFNHQYVNIHNAFHKTNGEIWNELERRGIDQSHEKYKELFKLLLSEKQFKDFLQNEDGITVKLFKEIYGNLDFYLGTTSNGNFGLVLDGESSSIIPTNNYLLEGSIPEAFKRASKEAGIKLDWKTDENGKRYLAGNNIIGYKIENGEITHYILPLSKDGKILSYTVQNGIRPGYIIATSKDKNKRTVYHTVQTILTWNDKYMQSRIGFVGGQVRDYGIYWSLMREDLSNNDLSNENGVYGFEDVVYKITGFGDNFKIVLGRIQYVNLYLEFYGNNLVNLLFYPRMYKNINAPIIRIVSRNRPARTASYQIKELYTWFEDLDPLAQDEIIRRSDSFLIELLGITDNLINEIRNQKTAGVNSMYELLEISNKWLEIANGRGEGGDFIAGQGVEIIKKTFKALIDGFDEETFALYLKDNNKDSNLYKLLCTEWYEDAKKYDYSKIRFRTSGGFDSNKFYFKDWLRTNKEIFDTFMTKHPDGAGISENTIEQKIYDALTYPSGHQREGQYKLEGLQFSNNEEKFMGDDDITLCNLIINIACNVYGPETLVYMLTGSLYVFGGDIKFLKPSNEQLKIALRNFKITLPHLERNFETCLNRNDYQNLRRFLNDLHTIHPSIIIPIDMGTGLETMNIKIPNVPLTILYPIIEDLGLRRVIDRQELSNYINSYFKEIT